MTSILENSKAVGSFRWYPFQLGKADQSVCFQHTVGNDKLLSKRRGPKIHFPALVKISHPQTYFIRRLAEQSLLQMHSGSANAGGITVGEAAGHFLKEPADRLEHRLMGADTIVRMISCKNIRL